MDVYSFLVASHIVGVALGVPGATLAEIFYLKAIRDGQIDQVEAKGLRVIYWVLRAGLAIAILSGFGFLIFYRLSGLEERLFDPKLWAKMTIILILLVNAILLTARKIPMWLGSSLSLTSWYAALILGAWHEMPYSYSAILMFYALAVAVVAVILEILRRIVSKAI